MLQDVPTMLGERYRVVERLGRGGMADVYRAEDVILRRPVAIKIFRGGVEREQHLARFRAEVRTLAGLTHPHLVALYDAGGDITEPWCAMEYVDGGSLADRDGPLPPADVARIGEQIAAALAYVHERGIVHRDVKPSNVLLNARGEAFLSDFGIAKLVDGTRMTQSGLMIGTAAFLSPEQVRGCNAGPASDVYALGLVLLEALTGHREYPGTPVESAVARLSRPPNVPAALERDWGDLIGSMTAEEADARPAPREVALRLRALARRLTGVVRFAPDRGDGLPEIAAGTATRGEVADDEEVADREADDGAADDGAADDGEVTPAPISAGPAAPAVVTSSLSIISLPVGQEPRNLLSWLSPDRRRRGAALLAAAGVVVAVAVALPVVDGRRQGVAAVRVDDAAATQPSSTTGAQPPGMSGDGTFQVRKAPVEVLPLPEADRVVGPVVHQGVRQRVAGVATTRPPRVKTPSPSPTASRGRMSSPSTSGPSSSAGPSLTSSPSPSSPSPLATSQATSDGTTSGRPSLPSPANSLPSIESLSRTMSGGSGSGGSPSSTDSPTLVRLGTTDLAGSGSAS